MNLTDRAKKRLTLAGLGVVCVVLVIAISLQFKTEEPKDASVQSPSMISDAVSPSSEIQTPPLEINAKPIDSSATNQSADTGNSTGTDQSIQAEVTKPPEPSQEVLTDPFNTPDGESVNEATPAENDKAIEPESTPSPSTPKSGDKKDGKIYVPGFGWIEDNGGGGSGTTVGNPGDELTGNKVGSMD